MTTLKLQSHRLFAHTISSEGYWAKLSRYVSRNYQCLVQSPGLFMVRKFGRIELLRDALFYVSKLLKPQYVADSTSSSAFKDLNTDAIVFSLKQKGYSSGINLPPTVLREILYYAYTKPCLGDRNPNFKFLYSDRKRVEASVGRKFVCSSYKVEDCPAIAKLINDPALLEIAAGFLQAKPVCVGTDLLWSFPNSKTWEQQLNMAQVFHYDLDDYRSVKLFFYLTDVDLESGSHVCIQQSHRGKKILHQLLGQRCASISDEKIVQTYGAENVVPFCGEAGFGFAEDPCCFHKGAPPTTKERLLLQIQYAVSSYSNIRAHKL